MLYFFFKVLLKNINCFQYGCFVTKQNGGLENVSTAFFTTDFLQQMSQVNRNICHPCRFLSFVLFTQTTATHLWLYTRPLQNITVHKSYFLWPIAWPFACVQPHMGLCRVHKHTSTNTTRTRLSSPRQHLLSTRITHVDPALLPSSQVSTSQVMVDLNETLRNTDL